MIEKTINSKTIDEDTVVIDPGIQLDNSNAHEMVEIIAGAQAQGHKYLIIDMRSLEFLSSSGVGAIIGSVEVSREAGGDIILCNVSETISNILRVLDLMDFLTIKSDTEDALNTCSM